MKKMIERFAFATGLLASSSAFVQAQTVDLLPKERKAIEQIAKRPDYDNARDDCRKIARTPVVKRLCWKAFNETSIQRVQNELSTYGQYSQAFATGVVMGHAVRTRLINFSNRNPENFVVYKGFLQSLKGNPDANKGFQLVRDNTVCFTGSQAHEGVICALQP